MAKTVKASILLIDDNKQFLDSAKDMLELLGYRVEAFNNADLALEAVQKTKYDLILMDAQMKGRALDGVEATKTIKSDPDGLNFRTPVVVVTAYPDKFGWEAAKAGASAFVKKSADAPQEIPQVIETILARHRSSEKSRLAGLKAGLKAASADFVAESAAFLGVVEKIERVAPTNATVLVTGETGVGKEVAARLIHLKSGRRQGPFVAVNLAKLTDPSLQNDDLFGHVKGAYTGAEAARDGLFKTADGGTFFLDELGDASLEVQAKLLRVIQEKKLEPVGSDKTVDIDVRLVAATSRDLVQACREGRFREDLFFRVSVYPIHVPSLRARPEDIEPLAGHFLQKFAAENGRAELRLAPSALEKLKKHHWPGNVRELENVIRRAAVDAAGQEVTEVSFDEPPRDDDGRGLPFSLEEMEKIAVKRALDKAGGNKTLAAKFLGVTPNTVREKMSKYGL
ncbi:MAG: sigma-54 dependent transcriptional regulator [Deltaproteobacteria bacterium]|jgi:two-component system response regulator HydG|nr:sigma-54 dependent transcriptional regulator [Deltaproteobacteria bacterium]